eukprot:TRINITY_DN23265_c0_g1_i1.p3 TRINITY_DN23265_c0_g1~~TRINITY_DN23265_c0_g1_i1.p3  ORF type:complete len:118 (+),score=3.56 TRINITY_DN23265_c0_g1_i1:409-762(+)
MSKDLSLEWSFFQNLKLNSLTLSCNITSTCSKDRPLVSGMKTRVKKRPATAMQPNSKNVSEVPMATVRVRNVCATIKLEIQHAVAAIPPHRPLNLRGYISELTTHGTVPIPGEKNAM